MKNSSTKSISELRREIERRTGKPVRVRAQRETPEGRLLTHEEVEHRFAEAMRAAMEMLPALD